MYVFFFLSVPLTRKINLHIIAIRILVGFLALFFCTKYHGDIIINIIFILFLFLPPLYKKIYRQKVSLCFCMISRWVRVIESFRCLTGRGFSFERTFHEIRSSSMAAIDGRKMQVFFELLGRKKKEWDREKRVKLSP